MNHSQLTEIEHPGLHDVLWGRGGHTTCHPGNVRYRNLTQNYRDAFKSAGKIRRLEIANEIVQKWRDQTPPGRFLVMTEPEKGSDSMWHDIGDRGAVQKVMGSLRQRKPKSDMGQPNVFQQAMRQRPQDTNENNYVQSTDMNTFHNWQETFSNAAKLKLAQGSQVALPEVVVNNTIVGVAIAPTPNDQTPDVGYDISYPFFATSQAYHTYAPSTVSEEDTAIIQPSSTSSQHSHAHNPSLTFNDNESEEVPLAAALTCNIFDEDLQSGVPLLSPIGGNSKLWNFGDLSFLAPGSINTNTSDNYIDPLLFSGLS